MFSTTYRKFSLGALLVSIGFISSAHALDFSRIPGLIPLKNGIASPASDLVKDGERLTPRLVQKISETMDTSLLDPVNPTDIWSTQVASPEEIARENAKLNFPVETVAQYAGSPGSPVHLFRFNAAIRSAAGITTYSFVMSKTIHNVLLRKALLEKLGYRVPPIRHVPRLTLQFDTPGGRELFLKSLTETNFADPARWVVENDEANNRLVLRDLVVTESQAHIYNFAFSRVPYDYIRDRRAFRALAILFELTEVPESVNGYPWSVGKIINNYLSLTFKGSDQFWGSYEDTRWILRRLAHLSRSDFEDVVFSTSYPTSAKLLILEKLISQRNSALEIFGIPGEPIYANTEISFGDELKDGKLVRENWPDYGSRFAFGDPEAPFSAGDYFAFARSKLYSNIISNLISRFNEELPNTDVSAKLTEHQKDIEMKQFADFFNTGKLEKIPNKLYAFPMGSMNVIAARDIVIGSYMGSNNMVQLADAVGLNLNAGLYLHMDNPSWPWTVGGNAMGSITRTYTHLRPIKSIKKALEYPFRNMLVPLVTGDIGETLKKIAGSEFDTLPEKEQTAKINSTVEELKKMMEVGESLVISDTIGAQLQANLKYGIKELTAIYPKFSAQQTLIFRMHVTRFNEDTFHIYVDRGDVGSLQLSLQFKAFVPIVDVYGKTNSGGAEIRFRPLVISKDEEKRKETLTNLRILNESIDNFSPYASAIHDEHFALKYDFKQSGAGLSFLVWKWKSLSTDQTVDVTIPKSLLGKYDDPAKRTRTYYRNSSGKMSGVDWEDFAVDLVNASLNELVEKNRYSMASKNNGRPGNTVFGKSKIREAIFEGRVDLQSKRLSDSFVSVKYNWEGWRLSREDAEKIIEEISEKLQANLFPFRALNTTEEIQFYNISLSYLIYNSAITNVLSLDAKTIREIFERYKTTELERTHRHGPPGRDFVTRYTLYDLFIGHLQSALKAQAKGKTKDFAEEIRQAFSLAESTISTRGMFVLVGGEENMTVQARIGGFRKGDEFGNTEYVPHTLGEFGAAEVHGPWEAARERIGASPSEFYLYWLLDRI